jgi:hypothetical protein
MAAAAVDPPEGVPEAALAGLYHGPLEQFTPQRNALVKELRAGDERGAAAWVKALRRPTRAAWLVNQLSVRKSDQVE